MSRLWSWTSWLLALQSMFFGVSAAVAMDLTALSVEELMQVEVVSAARQSQAWSDSAAAVFVITADDLRRTGVTQVAEALRLAPGVDVARIDSSRWAISIRGFNGRFANKLLVMIDGRSVYTPVFSGVYWELQDLPINDIARIEVIRGPGGSLWGANAVNGVINIITKSASETQGALVSVTAGNEERAIVDARYGGKLGESARYRIYGRSIEREGFVDPHGQSSGDDWTMQRGGFRLDWQPSARDDVVVLGDHYSGDMNQNMVVPILEPPYNDHRLDPVTASGNSLQARWVRNYSPTGQFSLQTYYQNQEHSDLQQDVSLETFDLDFQHSLDLGSAQQVVWGLNYRHYQDHYAPVALSMVDPTEATTSLFSIFGQDQIDFADARLRLTLGLRLERNDYTGWEWQPSARLLWMPTAQQRLWGSISRAVRTPSRVEEGRTTFFTLPLLPAFGGLPAVVTGVGSNAFAAEKLTAYEIGYRNWLNEALSLDVTAFYNDYDDLLSATDGAPYLVTEPAPHWVLPLYFNNGLNAANRGFEMAADWRPHPDWRLQLAYSHLWMSHPQRAWAPADQVSLLSSWRINDTLELDAWLRYSSSLLVQTLSTLGTVTVDPTWGLTLRLGWRPRPDLELALVGANLLSDHQLEFVQEAYTYPVEVERSLYGQLKWSF